MSKNNTLMDFLKANAWSILVLLFVSGGILATVNFRISVVEARAEDLTAKVESMQKLLERVIVLEEHDKNFTEDLVEIKLDLKEIKNLVK